MSMTVVVLRCTHHGWLSRSTRASIHASFLIATKCMPRSITRQKCYQWTAVTWWWVANWMRPTLLRTFLRARCESQIVHTYPTCFLKLPFITKLACLITFVPSRGWRRNFDPQTWRTTKTRTPSNEKAAPKWNSWAPKSFSRLIHMVCDSK
jgi:hypothetical protein